MPSQLPLKPRQAQQARREQPEDDHQHAAGEINLPPVRVQNHAQGVCA